MAAVALQSVRRRMTRRQLSHQLSLDIHIRPIRTTLFLMASLLVSSASSFAILPPKVFIRISSSSSSTASTCSSLTSAGSITTTTTTTAINNCHQDDNDSSSSSFSTFSSSTSSSSSSSSSDASYPASVSPLNSLRHVLGVASSTSTPIKTKVSQTVFPWIVGHRGCLYQELENTREGFQACAAMGCDAVELDVFLLPKCGTLIVFHGGGSDDNPGLLQDYCGVPGTILEYTYQEAITQLRFNPSYQEFGCDPDVTARGTIPTLEQVLSDAKDSGLFVKIELKGEGTVEPTIDLVEQLGMVHQVSYSSFDLAKLAQLRELRPDSTSYPTGALFSTAHLPNDYIQQAKECGATEIHLQYDSCTVQRIQDIHMAGLGSMCWMRGPIGMNHDCTTKYWDVGNEDLDMYQALIDTGVQQLCINKPDVLIQWRQQQQQEQPPPHLDSLEISSD